MDIKDIVILETKGQFMCLGCYINHNTLVQCTAILNTNHLFDIICPDCGFQTLNANMAFFYRNQNWLSNNPKDNFIHPEALTTQIHDHLGDEQLGSVRNP